MAYNFYPNAEFPFTNSSFVLLKSVFIISLSFFSIPMSVFVLHILTIGGSSEITSLACLIKPNYPKTYVQKLSSYSYLVIDYDFSCLFQYLDISTLLNLSKYPYSFSVNIHFFFTQATVLRTD